MAIDLSAIDAQLAALGPMPKNLPELVEAAKVPFSSLSEADAQLQALGAGSFQVAAPVRPARRDPKSGEIALPEPILRQEQPASGEIHLDEQTPRSGSYALDPGPSELDEEQIDTDAPAAEVRSIAVPAPRIEIAQAELSPLSLFPEGDDEPPTARDALDPSTEVPQAKHEAAKPTLDRPLGPLAVRDPDAEFDSLFEEATSPSGVPTRSLDDDGLSIEDLLSGLSSSNKLGARVPSASESDSALDALFDMEEGDSTEVVEAKSVFGEGGLPNLDPFPAEEELGSSEFEIVLDEAGAAKDIIRSDRPAAPKKSPPPPALEDKRPSFLGRLFGKKDE